MFVYKLTCSETNKVYYGATKNTPEHRKSRGHYKCTCKDFVNPTIEIVEKCNSIEEMYEREKYFIQNNECVNIKCKIIDKKAREQFYAQQYRLRNPEKIKQLNKEQSAPIECDICGKLTSLKHIARHKKSQKCLHIKDNKKSFV